MTLEKLASKLEGLDETRRHAERELMALRDQQQRVEELESDRDALRRYIAELPIALDNLSGEERNRVYRMLRLEIKPTLDGYEITGVFLQKGMDALASMRNRTTSELRFRSLLTGAQAAWKWAFSDVRQQSSKNSPFRMHSEPSRSMIHKYLPR